MREALFAFINLICNILTIYTGACFIRIIFSWFPNLAYSGFGRLLSAVCDPYLNFFKRFRFLRLGFIDFSAALGIGVLWALGIVLRSLTNEALNFGAIIGFFIGAIWQLISTILTIYTIVLVVRCIALLFHNPSQPESPFWLRLDSLIAGFIYKISNIFTGSRRVSYKTALIISIIFFIAVNLLMSRLINDVVVAFFNSLGDSTVSNNGSFLDKGNTPPAESITPDVIQPPETVPDAAPSTNITPFIDPKSRSI